MDDRELIARLIDVEPEGGFEAARLRTVRAAHAGIAARRGRLRARLAICLTVLLAATSMSLTPPGRAAATWIAEQVGIGEPGGEPTLSRLHRGWIPDARGTVVAGKAADGTGLHFEIVGMWQGGHPCLSIDELVTRGAMFSCRFKPLEDGAVLIEGYGGSSGGRRDTLLAYGYVTDEAARIESTLGGAEVRSTLIRLKPEVTARFGLAGTDFFVATLPPGTDDALLEVTALDRDGAPIGEPGRFEIQNFRLDRPPLERPR